MTQNKIQPLPTLGFGVPADPKTNPDPHHFKVIIPRSKNGDVLISEYLGIQGSSKIPTVIDRVELDRERWDAIKGALERDFNRRLEARGLKPSTWKVGGNMVDRLLGKELCVLAWAVEQMDKESIPVAVRNWVGMYPEDRWWLYGMTVMDTGGVMDAGKSWRAALRHALGDEVHNEQEVDETQTQRCAHGPDMYV